jgi:hypothetical protein
MKRVIVDPAGCSVPGAGSVVMTKLLGTVSENWMTGLMKKPAAVSRSRTEPIDWPTTALSGGTLTCFSPRATVRVTVVPKG